MAEASRATVMSAVSRTLPSLISALTYGWRGSVSSPFGSLRGHDVAVELDLDSARDDDGLLTDSAHIFLPDLTEDFAADFLLFGFAIRHDALRSGEDRHREAAAHARDRVLYEPGTRAGRASTRA